MTAPTLHTPVLNDLGRRIARGELRPGTALTLDAVQARYEVSRTVAREAMRVLESYHLVASKRRIGIVVQPAGSWDVLAPDVIHWRLDGGDRVQVLGELTELRSAVEPAAAAAAARRAAPAQAERLVALAARLRKEADDGSSEAFLEADVEFHTLILESSANAAFRALTVPVQEVLMGRTRLGLMPRHPRPRALAGHEGVAQTIAAGDTISTRTHINDLVAEVREALLEHGLGHGQLP